MREKIGGFSELTGCSEQTIRYYESLGLLHPEHAGESGYRYFTEQNLAELTQVRMLRGLDVPLARIAQGNDDIPFLLSEQEQALSERISQLEDELQRVRRLQQRFYNVTGTPQPVSLNGVWRLMLSDPGVLASPEGRSLAKEWIALMPYSHYTIIIPQEQIESGHDVFSPRWGIGVLDRYAHLLTSPPKPPAQHWPKAHGIVAGVVFSDPSRPTRQELSAFFRYRDEKLLSFDGDMYGVLNQADPAGEKWLFTMHISVC